MKKIKRSCLALFLASSSLTATCLFPLTSCNKNTSHFNKLSTGDKEKTAPSGTTSADYSITLKTAISDDMSFEYEPSVVDTTEGSTLKVENFKAEGKTITFTADLDLSSNEEKTLIGHFNVKFVCKQNDTEIWNETISGFKITSKVDSIKKYTATIDFTQASDRIESISPQIFQFQAEQAGYQDVQIKLKSSSYKFKYFDFSTQNCNTPTLSATSTDGLTLYVRMSWSALTTEQAKQGMSISVSNLTITEDPVAFTVTNQKYISNVTNDYTKSVIISCQLLNENGTACVAQEGNFDIIKDSGTVFTEIYAGIISAECDTSQLKKTGEFTLALKLVNRDGKAVSPIENMEYAVLQKVKVDGNVLEQKESIVLAYKSDAKTVISGTFKATGCTLPSYYWSINTGDKFSKIKQAATPNSYYVFLGFYCKIDGETITLTDSTVIDETFAGHEIIAYAELSSAAVTGTITLAGSSNVVFEENSVLTTTYTWIAASDKVSIGELREDIEPLLKYQIKNNSEITTKPLSECPYSISNYWKDSSGNDITDETTYVRNGATYIIPFELKETKTISGKFQLDGQKSKAQLSKSTWEAKETDTFTTAWAIEEGGITFSEASKNKYKVIQWIKNKDGVTSVVEEGDALENDAIYIATIGLNTSAWSEGQLKVDPTWRSTLSTSTWQLEIGSTIENLQNSITINLASDELFDYWTNASGEKQSSTSILKNGQTYTANFWKPQTSKEDLEITDKSVTKNITTPTNQSPSFTISNFKYDRDRSGGALAEDEIERLQAKIINVKENDNDIECPFDTPLLTVNTSSKTIDVSLEVLSGKSLNINSKYTFDINIVNKNTSEVLLSSTGFNFTMPAVQQLYINDLSGGAVSYTTTEGTKTYKNQLVRLNVIPYIDSNKTTRILYPEDETIRNALLANFTINDTAMLKLNPITPSGNDEEDPPEEILLKVLKDEEVPELMPSITKCPDNEKYMQLTIYFQAFLKDDEEEPQWKEDPEEVLPVFDYPDRTYSFSDFNIKFKNSETSEVTAEIGDSETPVSAFNMYFQEITSDSESIIINDKWKNLVWNSRAKFCDLNWPTVANGGITAASEITDWELTYIPIGETTEKTTRLKSGGLWNSYVSVWFYLATKLTPIIE